MLTIFIIRLSNDSFKILISVATSVKSHFSESALLWSFKVEMAHLQSFADSALHEKRKFDVESRAKSSKR